MAPLPASRPIRTGFLRLARDVLETGMSPCSGEAKSYTCAGSGLTAEARQDD